MVYIIAIRDPATRHDEGFDDEDEFLKTDIENEMKFIMMAKKQLEPINDDIKKSNEYDGGFLNAYQDFINFIAYWEPIFKKKIDYIDNTLNTSNPYDIKDRWFEDLELKADVYNKCRERIFDQINAVSNLKNQLIVNRRIY